MQLKCCSVIGISSFVSFLKIVIKFRNGDFRQYLFLKALGLLTYLGRLRYASLLLNETYRPGEDMMTFECPQKKTS